jgi:hypothetical protein
VSEMESDWTVDPETGRCNSSAEFLRLEDEVARLLTSNGGQALSRAWARGAARLILAQLTHKHGFAPPCRAELCEHCGKTYTGECGPGCINQPTREHPGG